MENIRKIGKYSFFLVLLLLIFMFLVGLLFYRAVENDYYTKESASDFISQD